MKEQFRIVSDQVKKASDNVGALDRKVNSQHIEITTLKSQNQTLLESRLQEVATLASALQQTVHQLDEALKSKSNPKAATQDEKVDDVGGWKEISEAVREFCPKFLDFRFCIMLSMDMLTWQLCLSSQFVRCLVG